MLYLPKSKEIDTNISIKGYKIRAYSEYMFFYTISLKKQWTKRFFLEFP